MTMQSFRSEIKQFPLLSMHGAGGLAKEASYKKERSAVGRMDRPKPQLCRNHKSAKQDCDREHCFSPLRPLRLTRAFLSVEVREQAEPGRS